MSTTSREPIMALRQSCKAQVFYSGFPRADIAIKLER